MPNKSIDSSAAETIVPVFEEQLAIEIQQNVTGAVRINKKAYTRQAVVEQEVMREHFSIERVPVNKTLDELISVRQEGGVTIIPVIEEVVVISKKLILKEEIRITRRQELFCHQETVPLRSEEVTIERVEPPK